MSASSQINRLPSQSLSQLLGNSIGAPITTTIKEFDDSLDGGFLPGQIYEVCGTNGSGKSSLAAQLVVNCLEKNKNALWISTLQAIPFDKVNDYCHGKEVFLKKLDHIRLNTLGSLTLFLQSLPIKPTKYSLIIIDDFASCITRCFDENEQMIKSTIRRGKPVSLEYKKNRSIQNILKLLSTYCATNKSSCVLINNSNLLSMSFVETKPHVSLAPSRSSSSSGSFSSQSVKSSQMKPKRFNQQILISPLGDHPFWSSYFKARITLYRDWISSNFSMDSTAIFVHLKQNKLHKGPVQLKPISFQETKTGITQVSEDVISLPSNISHSFTLEEEDFGTDPESEVEEDVQELRTTEMNGPPVLLPSSPRHKDISTAKNILPDDLLTETGLLGSSQSKDEATGTDDVGNQDIAEENEIGEEAAKAIEEEVNGENESNDIESASQVEANVELNSKEPTPSGNESGEHLEEDETTDRPTLIEDTTVNNHIQSVPIYEDTSLEFEEIEDELEELYPTQPESLTIAQLSQLENTQTSKLQPFKRNTHHLLNKSVKRLRLPLQDSTNTNYDYHPDSYGSQLSSEEYIPASAPYF